MYSQRPLLWRSSVASAVLISRIIVAVGRADVAGTLVGSFVVLFLYGYIMTLTWERAASPADLGRRIAQIRAPRSLIQRQVAEPPGINRRYDCEIEAGKPGLYSHRLFRLTMLLPARTVIEGGEAS